MSVGFRFLFGVLFFVLLSCKTNKKDFDLHENLYSIEDTSVGISRYGYSDSIGNIIVPFGRYRFNYTDTIKTIGFVLADDGSWAINKRGERLFRVYPSPNNGPDEIEEGVFRILGEDGTIGFADINGEVVISPRFKSVDKFSDGFAVFCSTCPVGLYKTVQTEKFRQALLNLSRTHPNKIFVISGRKYGLINIKGDTVLKPVYEKIFPTKNGVNMVYREGRVFYVGFSSKEVAYESVNYPTQQSNDKDILERIIYVKDEDELLKLGESF